MVVPKKNGKLKICVDIRKFNKATKKNPYPLAFSNEVLNTIVGYEAYSFLDGYSRCHHISITLENRYKTTLRNFVWMVMPFGVKNGPPTFQRTLNKAFK
jgi:CRISPR/Cas system-associated protein Cas10 (large subunit of type III CRISPR-Cas system)